MNTQLLVLYVISVFMLIITPGPVVALVINTSMKHGPKRAVLTVLGTNAASLLLALAAVLILAGGLTLNPAWLNGLSVLGCGFIAYLAVQGLREVRHMGAQASVSAVPRQTSRGGAALKGFLVGISNPKDILFFVSFFPQFLKVSDSLGTSALLLVGVWIVIDFAVLAFYVALAHRVFSLKYKATVTRLSSVVLLAVAGGGIAYSGQALWALKG